MTPIPHEPERPSSPRDKETHGPMDLPPAYPHEQADDRQPQLSSSGGTRLVIAAVVLAFVTIVLLHLTGVIGPGAH